MSPPTFSGRVLILAALCGLAASCGLTTRNDKPSGPIPDAGVDAEVDPDDPCVVRPPITKPVANCAYPVAPMDNPPQLASVESLKRPNCVYQLGEAIPLPFDEGRYAFSYDVNGDQVGDVFFWTATGIQLAISRVGGGQLSYEPTSCDALGTISFSESTAFVRDLNADAVPDLVLGVGSLSSYDDGPFIQSALRAFVNVPTGFVEVFRHDWPEPLSKTSLLDVAVADFDRNGACVADIAFGYDRVFNETGGSADGVEFGGLVALMEGAEPPLTHRERKWVYKTSVNSDPEYPIVDGQYVLPYGEVAAGKGPGAPVWIGLVQDPVEGVLLRWEGGEVTEQLVEMPPHEETESVFDVWISPLWDIDSALVLMRGRLMSRLEVYDLDDLARGMVAEHRVHTTGWNRLPGGGVRRFTRGMLDVEGDGDMDFVEQTDSIDPDGSALAIHRNSDGAFGEGSEFEINRYREGWAEHPFIAVGGAQAALIVNYASGEDGAGPPTVQPLECAP